MCNLLAYISQAIFEHLPCQRQLDVEVRAEAESLLKMKVNKKLLRQHLTEVTGKVIIIVMCMYVSLPMLLLGCDAKGYYKQADLSVSKQRLLQTNLHKFLCIDYSFSEAVFYSFSRHLVEVARQPVPYHRRGSRLAGVVKHRDLGCK